MAETFTIEDFPGYFRGISETQLPPGAVVDLNRTGCRTFNVRVTDSGELSTSHGYSRVAGIGQVLAGSSFSAVQGNTYPSAVYCWEPTSGGSVVMLANAQYVSRLQITNTSDPVNYNPYVFSCRGQDTSVPFSSADQPITWATAWSSYTGRSPVFGKFVPYKSSLYYCDGLNFPLRIYPVNSPRAYPMGVLPLSSVDLSSKIQLEKTLYSGKRDSIPVSAQYVVTLDTPFGESMSWPLSGGALVVGSSQAGYRYRAIRVASWSGFPSHTRGLNIYRKSSDGVYRFALYLPKGVTMMVDNTPDLVLNAGTPISLSVGQPHVFRTMAMYQDRMFAVGGHGGVNRLFVSEVGHPDVWSAGDSEITAVDSNKGGMITAIEEIYGSLYFFHENRITRLYGEYPSYGFAQVTESVGCVAPRSMATWQDGRVFVARSGVYYFDGSTFRCLSDPVQGYFSSSSVGQDDAATAVGAVAHGQYYLSFHDGSPTGDSTRDVPFTGVLSFNLKNGRVGYRRDGAFLASCPFGNGGSLVVGPLERTELCVSELSGYPSYDDGSTNVVQQAYPASVYQMSFFMPGLDFKLPGVEKILESVEVWYECASYVDVRVWVSSNAEYNSPGSGSEVSSASNTDASGLDSVQEWGTTTWGDPGSLFAEQKVRSWTGNFTRAAHGKSFGVQVSLKTGANACKVLKVIFRYSVGAVNSRSSGYTVPLVG
jgi:hypothetical protein